MKERQLRSTTASWCCSEVYLSQGGSTSLTFFSLLTCWKPSYLVLIILLTTTMKQALKWSVFDLLEKRNINFYVWFRSDLSLFSFKIKCTWNQIPILIPFRAQSEHQKSSWSKYGMFPANIHWIMIWEANNCSIVTKLTYPKEKF